MLRIFDFNELEAKKFWEYIKNKDLYKLGALIYKLQIKKEDGRKKTV